MEFKNKLKELRKQYNFTQDALAQELHVSRSTIAKWEAGLGLPQKDSIVEICKIFNISEEDLISTNIKEEILVNKNLKIHTLNKKILIMSISFSIIVVLIIIITSLIVSSIKEVNNLSDVYTTIHLMNYKNSEAKEVATAGEINYGETILNTEYGYSHQKITFEKIKFTDKSSLVLIMLYNQFTPGIVAYENGDDSFKKNATMDSSYIEINFNDDVNKIYSWPKNDAGWVSVNSKFSNNVIYDFNMFFSRIHFQKFDNQLQFYYSESFDDIILSPDMKEIIREFDYNESSTSTLWNYKMYNEAKISTLHAYSYYLIEVNDQEEYNSFEFSIRTGIISGRKIIERKQYITCQL